MKTLSDIQDEAKQLRRELQNKRIGLVEVFSDGSVVLTTIDARNQATACTRLQLRKDDG